MDLKKLRNLVATVSDRTREATRQASGQSWYKVSNLVEDETRVDINGEIGDWGVTSADFVNAISGITSSKVYLHINSPGGSVFEGLGIYENIKQHPAEWTALIDGVAASAASFIAMACERVEMGKRARMMIHDASGGCIGTAADMRQMADLLDDLSDNCADIYVEKAGGTRAEWRDRMQAGSANSGTWLAAEPAIQLGLADGIIGVEKPGKTAPAEENDESAAADDEATNSFDLEALQAALTEVFK